MATNPTDTLLKMAQGGNVMAAAILKNHAVQNTGILPGVTSANAGEYTKLYDKNFAAHQATINAPAKNPFTWVDAPNYKAPAKGTAGYTTGFGSGLWGDSNAGGFNINQWGAGLWGAGLDPNDPNLGYRLWEFNNEKMKSNDTDYQKRVKEQIAKHGWDMNTQKGLAEAVDWYYRDLGRRMDKSNSFMDSTLGKIISMAAPFAVPGIGTALGLVGSTGAGVLGAATGAVMGGVQGGPLGAVLGGIGGFGAGGLANSVVTNGLGNTINNAVSGFTDMFGGGSSAASGAGQAASTAAGGINAAANAVPGASTGITTPAGGAAIIGSGTADTITGLAGSGGAALGASPLAVAGGALAAGANLGTVSAITNAISGGAPGVTTSIPGTTNTPVPGTNQVPTGATGASGAGSGATTNASTGAAAGAGAASTGSSAMQRILGALGGTGGLGSGALSLLQGILGQMGQSDLESLANRINQGNQQLLNYMPPMSYRDSILNNLDMIMNRPGQLMEQGPYKDYMDYAQRAVERKMVAQGYGGVGQSTNTADAVTRAVMESMSGIIQRDREIATNQIEPFFRVAMTGAGNMSSSAPIELNMATNAANADSWRQIISGGASILNSTGILQNIFG